MQTADEDDVDLLAEDRLAGLEVHVLERALERATLARVGLVGRARGRALVIGMPMPGFVP